LPDLIPAAALAARNLQRSYQAQAKLYDKACYQEQSRKRLKRDRSVAELAAGSFFGSGRESLSGAKRRRQMGLMPRRAST
jgi:hypothetical protein